MYSSLSKPKLNFSFTFMLLSAKAFTLDQSKILSFVKELTLSQTTVLDPSMLKEFAGDNLEFDENGRKFSKMVENNVGKGENLSCRYVKTRACFGKG